MRIAIVLVLALSACNMTTEERRALGGAMSGASDSYMQSMNQMRPQPSVATTCSPWGTGMRCTSR